VPYYIVVAGLPASLRHTQVPYYIVVAGLPASLRRIPIISSSVKFSERR